MNLNFAAKLRSLRLPAAQPNPPASVTFFELPNALSGGVVTLAPMVVPADSTTDLFAVYLSQNYAYSGDAPDSYLFLSSGSGLAISGYFQADYPLSTDLVDLRLGASAVVQSSLPTATASTDYLIFAGNEIMSVVGVTLTGVNTYLLNLARGRYGTHIEDHPAAQQFYFISQSQLTLLRHAQFRPGNTVELKTVTRSNGVLVDLSDVDAQDVAIQGNIYQLPAPLALTVNGTAFNPIFSNADPISLAWVLPDISSATPRPDVSTLSTRLQFYVGGVLSFQLDVPWPNAALQIPWAQINAGARANFTVKAYTACNPDWQDILSASPTILNVTKV